MGQRKHPKRTPPRIIIRVNYNYLKILNYLFLISVLGVVDLGQFRDRCWSADQTWSSADTEDNVAGGLHLGQEIGP